MTDLCLKVIAMDNIVLLLSKILIQPLSAMLLTLLVYSEGMKHVFLFVPNLMRQLKNCFGFDTFFATDVRRFGDGGIFIGNLRRPIDEVIPKLEKKLSEAAGREVVLWFMEEKTNDITKQVLEHELMYITMLYK